MTKIKVGRPIKYTYKEKLALLNELEAYIEGEEYPTMPKFCVKHSISKQRIYEWAKNEKGNEDTKKKYPLGEYFDELIKRMNNKQEDFIEQNALKGNISTAFAIFKLKQAGFGWTDRVEQTSTNVNATIDVTNMTPEERQARIKKLLERQK